LDAATNHLRRGPGPVGVGATLPTVGHSKIARYEAFERLQELTNQEQQESRYDLLFFE
jgi:hypothetical protein